MHFGVPMSGAVLNVINTSLDDRTVSDILDPASLPLLLSARRLLPSDAHPIIIIPIEDPYEEELHHHNFSFLTTYEKLLEEERGKPEFSWVRPQREWDPMVHPVFLWTLPMFHANGWSFPWGVAAVAGTNVCLRRVDAPTVYSALCLHSCTHMCGAPAVLNMLANFPPSFSSSSDSALPGHPVHVLTAGAAPPAAALHRAERLGFRASHGYGLTETAGLVVSCPWKGEWDRLPALERAREGLRMPGMATVDVVDVETGRPVARNGTAMGVIVLRGGCVMLGYLKDAAATALAIRADGWFYTGDLGVMHPDGYLEIKRRSENVIISCGENISSVSVKVEKILY